MRTKRNWEIYIYAAFFLAIAVLLQSLRLLMPMIPGPVNMFLIGSLVNMTLVMAVVYTGKVQLAALGLLLPCIAFFQGALPLVLMIPVVGIGNLPQAVLADGQVRSNGSSGLQGGVADLTGQDAKRLPGSITCVLIGRVNIDAADPGHRRRIGLQGSDKGLQGLRRSTNKDGNPLTVIADLPGQSVPLGQPIDKRSKPHPLHNPLDRELQSIDRGGSIGADYHAILRQNKGKGNLQSGGRTAMQRTLARREILHHLFFNK